MDRIVLRGNNDSIMNGRHEVICACPAAGTSKTIQFLVFLVDKSMGLSIIAPDI